MRTALFEQYYTTFVTKTVNSITSQFLGQMSFACLKSSQRRLLNGECATMTPGHFMPPSPLEQPQSLLCASTTVT